MEAEITSKIKETVIEILKNADIDEMTEFKVRNIASQKLGGMDLSLPEPKQFVRSILESFLLSTLEEDKPLSVSLPPPPPPPTTTTEEEEEPPLPSTLPEELKLKEIAEEKVVAEEKEEEKETEEEAVEIKPVVGNKEIDEYGDVIICRLSDKRRVTVQDFKGKTLVSIREYYEKDGKQLPSSKGISLSNEQWSAFSTAVPAIEEAIKTMESRLG